MPSPSSDLPTADGDHGAMHGRRARIPLAIASRASVGSALGDANGSLVLRPHLSAINKKLAFVVDAGEDAGDDRS